MQKRSTEVVDEAKETAESGKRQKVDEKGSPPKIIASVKHILNALSNGDIVPALGLKVGDELEVLWELEQEEKEEDIAKPTEGDIVETKEDDVVEIKDGEEPTKDSGDAPLNEQWWSCTISKQCSHKHKLVDGVFNDEIAVYELKYEPLEGNANYESTTCSTVCFLGETILYDIEYNNILQWRSKSSDGKPSGIRNPVIADAIKRFAKDNDIEAFEKRKRDRSDNEIIPIPHGKTQEASEQLVNAILGNVVATHIAAMKKLPASTQYSMADKVAAVKGILIQKIAHCLETKKILDAEAVREIIHDMTPMLRKLQES